MRILAAITVFLFAQSALATEFKIRPKSGKVDFAYGTVNGTTVWSAAEFNKLSSDFQVFSATNPVLAVVITPTQQEINISTCVLSGFDSADEFREAQTQRGIITFLEQLITRREAFQAAGMKNKADDLQQRIDYLGSIAKSLP